MDIYYTSTSALNSINSHRRALFSKMALPLVNAMDLMLGAEANEYPATSIVA